MYFMKEDNEFELNGKIVEIMSELGFSSSKFADFIGISRPVMSHIVAKRNKASLEIVQRIALKLPELGLNWTFPKAKLDYVLLNKIADRIEKEALLNPDDKSETIEKTDAFKSKHIVRVVVYYSDNTYTEIPSANELI